jgi:hypothetical protein
MPAQHLSATQIVMAFLGCWVLLAVAVERSLAAVSRVLGLMRGGS